MYRQTYLEVDCDRLKNNIIDIKKNYSDYNYYFGVVKANTYGHGNFAINSLIDGGINYLAVSSLEEALRLRDYNKEIPILVLEPINIEFLNICMENNITITVSNLEYFEIICKLVLPSKLKFHVKIDSGMSRLGIQHKQELNCLFNLKEESISSHNLYLEGIYTHFATSGIHDKHWDDQLECFKNITSDIDLSKIPIVHMGRSQTLVNHEKIPFCNGIRLGIIMYGMDLKMQNNNGGIRGILRKLKYNYISKNKNISTTTTTNSLNICPAIKLCSEVMEVRTIKPDSFVSYGALFTTLDKATIATLPIGYADGVPKNLKQVEINGKLFNIVGEICMDMLMVKVDDSVKVHDKVILIGGDLLPVKSVARQTELSSYALFTGITTRVPRIYLHDNVKTEISYFN